MWHLLRLFHAFPPQVVFRPDQEPASLLLCKRCRVCRSYFLMQMPRVFLAFALWSARLSGDCQQKLPGNGLRQPSASSHIAHCATVVLYNRKKPFARAFPEKTRFFLQKERFSPAVHRSGMFRADFLRRRGRAGPKKHRLALHFAPQAGRPAVLPGLGASLAFSYTFWAFMVLMRKDLNLSPRKVRTP